MPSLVPLDAPSPSRSRPRLAADGIARAGGAARRGAGLAAVTGLLALSACAPAPTPPPLGVPVPFADGSALVEHLQRGGVDLEPLGTSQYVWFAAPATTYQVGSSEGDVLYIHEHADAAEAADAARRVSPDGSHVIGPDNKDILVQWLGEPHLYQNGRLLVVYVGTDPNVLSRLGEAMGAQFAGSEAKPQVGAGPPAAALPAPVGPSML